MKKRLLSTLLIAAMVLSIFSMTAATGADETPELHPYICGDADGNGVVTILDALEILMFLAGIDSTIKDNPDADKAARGPTQGETPSISDALEILIFLAGMDSFFKTATCPDCDWCGREPDLPVDTTVSEPDITALTTTGHVVITTNPVISTTIGGTSGATGSEPGGTTTPAVTTIPPITTTAGLITTTAPATTGEIITTGEIPVITTGQEIVMPTVDPITTAEPAATTVSEATTTPVVTTVPVTTTPEVTTTTVPAAELALTPASMTFADITAGGTRPAAQQVTITNTGGPAAGVTVALSGTNASSFGISTALSSATIPAGGTATFSIRPNASLAAGTYTATVTVSGTGFDSQTMTVSFTVNPQATVMVTPANITFSAATVGYTQPTAQTVTVTSGNATATGALTVALSGTNASSFTLSATSLASITSSGGTQTFTVRPNAGLAAGTYTATVTVSGGGIESRTVAVGFTVNPVSTISISPNPLTFAAATVGYTQPTAQTVTVTSGNATATGALTVALSGTNASSFTLSATSLASITSSGGTRTFTIRPNAGLAAGTYTATVTVSGGTGIVAQTMTVSFTVNAAANIAVTPATITFAAITAGGAQPAAQTVTVTNSGGTATSALTVALSGTNANSFTLSATSLTAIAAGANRTFTVRPNAGLAAGTYTATVTVSGTGITSRTMTVSFTVNAAAFTITFNQNYTGAPANTTATTSGANNRLTAAQIPTPTRSGFTFAGWFNTSAATGGTQLTATTNHTANTTYWARWTASGGTTPNFQNMTAHQVVANMGAGWNLGNTFDAFSNGSYSNPIDSRDWTNWGWGANYGAMTILRMETGWLEAYPILGSESRVTQQLINNVKAAGFDTIRIPVTWHKALNVNTWNNNSPPTNFTIRADWMARVKQVVDWAIAADMYVILNTHHDEYIMPFETTAQTDRSVATLARLWSLIAAEFNNSYDHRLIFEVLNEPRVKGHAQEWEGGRRDHRQNLNRLNQAAVSAIRDTGGNNRWRILMIPTYAAGATPSWANNQGGSFDSFVMPADRNSAGTTINTVNKFILSIHSYEPGNFAGIWGPLTMSWSEAGIRDVMNLIQTNATRMGVPVVLGEWGSVGRDNSPTHANEVIRANHARFYVQEAARRGFVPVWWDTGILANVNTVEGRWGIMNRRTGAVHYTNITAAIREGLAAGRALR